MRKIYKIIGGMLAAGVLIAGIGSGVAFAEYSNFEYGGEKVLDDSKYITKTVTYQVPDQGGTEEKKEIYIEIMEGHLYSEIEEDASVPKNTVRFEIQYLTDRKDIKPEVEEQTWMNQDNKAMKYIRLNSDYTYNEFRDFMRIKNLVLEDLKAHTLSDYQIDGIKSIKILINPDADFLVTLDSDDFYNEYDAQDAEEVTEGGVEATTEVSVTEVSADGYIEEPGDGIEATTEVVDEGDTLEE